MDLFDDVKLVLEQDLAALAIQYGQSATLEEILILRCTHMRKTILPMPRTAHESREFQGALAACTTGEQQAMAAIRAKFHRGEDVNGHLSRASLNPHIPDGMLYDWDIYHIHVSCTKSNPSQAFFDRTGPVALVKVTRTDSYFIDIRPHGTANPLLWTQTDILEILNNNWPTLLDSWTIPNAVSTVHNPSSSDLSRLRGNRRTGKGAVVAVLQIGNRVIAPPGGGMATDGTPNTVLEAVDQIQYNIKDIEQYLVKNGGNIKAEVAPQINVPVANQDFKLVRNNGCWMVVERTSGQAVGIRQLNSLLGRLPAAP